MAETMNSVDQLAFDQEKVLAWWTGRITNADLALWTGQSERDIRLILDTPFMRREIQGGGRGSKNTRRISRKARNAVAIVGALRKAGMSIDAACALLDALPVIADLPTESIDFSPGSLESSPAPYGNLICLGQELPNKGWLMTDIVPGHVFNRHCRPVVKKDVGLEARLGTIAWWPDWMERAFTRDAPGGFRPFGLPIYRPEIDPFGIYEHGNTSPDSDDPYDYHFYVVDGRWVWIRFSDPAPREYALDAFQHFELHLDRRFSKDDLKFHFDPAAEIDFTSKAVTPLHGDEDLEKRAQASWTQPLSKLDINASLAVRQMKRVAYGLVPPP